ncbi:17-beta-hydroxysteroid dehydrogenase type 6-like isoform X2 [Bacillus rossius redtenbacheri]
MCAKRLDALGVTVYAGCLFPEGAGAAQLKAAASSRLHIVPLDVTRDEDVRKAVEYVKQTIGDKKFWCVLNNAGILSDLLLEHNSMDAVRKVMEVNALGTVSVTQSFLPLLGDESGRVVCVVSIFGRVAIPFCVPYCMSKHAALAYVQGLRRELQLTSSGVTVHGIEPSVYRTPLSDSEIRIAQIKKQLAGSPEDIQKKVNELYIEKYKLFYRRAVKFTSNPNENEVVDCMIDAAIGSTPKPCYRPNVRCLVEGWLLKWIPTAVVDWALTTAARILASDLLDTRS